MRSILATRRQALADLLDDLAPLSEEEARVVPQLRQMLDAVDPQEVYAARIALAIPQQAVLDGLVDRLCALAEAGQQPEALAFMRNLQALPKQ